MVARNVADAVEPPRIEKKREIRALSAQEVQRLLDVAHRESRQPELYVLAVTTGMRLGELLGLRWQDIVPPVAYVRQALKKAGPNPVFAAPKTQKGFREVWLPLSAVAALEAVRVRQQAEKSLAGESYEDHDLVFAQPNGRPLDGHNVSQREFKRLLSPAGLPDMRFHDLRHTNATLLLEAGVPAKVVSERLGHSGIGITLDIYSHVLPTMQEQAASKLEEMLFGRDGDGAR
ncbi:MAG: site-specific integrase [Firmicutes bacterium]|nr:site-specific integrase [Bacillota bacterium]